CLKKIGLMKTSTRNRMVRMGNHIKSALTGGSNIFEGLNIRYFGQLDGHNIDQLVKVLTDIKNFQGPRVLHIKTTKGKGFAPAENSATVWHAPGLYNPETGERIKSKSTDADLYQDVFGQTLLDLAEVNKNIVGVTPAMPTGCSMNIMMQKMPDRVFDVGIAEAHAVTFSAGMAKEGLMPFCNIYSSFMQRAYDQIIHDVALQNLNMVLCLDRAGLVGADGPTHHGAFDMAYLRCIPNLTIASPLNELELRNLMFTAQLEGKGTFVLRYPRGAGEGVVWKDVPMQEIPVGKGQVLKQGSKVAVLTIGPIGNTVMKAVESLGTDASEVGVYDMRFLKPLDTELLDEIFKKYKTIVTVEDGSLRGGFGSAVLEYMADSGVALPVKRIGIPDNFIEHGSPQELYHMLGMDSSGITSVLRQYV
ncbi:MAG: 1-deoxy-D-xylulose-5-phosphate synthase, partial [Paludibacteraceae bacterium]|nr:1-deoxy-D-xylulose-5-phosphate synthase [Paludibacteraceae bacterium]